LGIIVGEGGIAKK